MVLDMKLTPVFGVISDILVFDVNSYHFVCEELITECFNHHYHSYEVKYTQPNSFIVCQHKDLVNHNVLSLYKRFGYLFVSLKYYIVEKI